MRTLLSTLILSVAVNAAEVQKTNEQFVVAKGLAVRPFATQAQLSNPSSIDVDDRGRVWVAEAFNYRKKTRKAGDRILILEDSNADGRADKTTVFYQNPDIDGVHGVCVLGNMAIVSVSDRILLLTDTDGDDKADVKKVLFTGKVLNPVNGQHDHAIHAVMFGPDGRLYFNFGNLNAGLWRADGTLVKDVFGNPVDNSRKPYQEGMVIRCELDGSKVEVLGHNFRNNWEVTVDSFGTMWQSDNDNGSSSCRVNFVMEYGNYGYRDERTGADYHSKRTNMEATMQRRMWHQNDPGVIPNLLITGSGAPTGILVYEGDLLPEPFRGQMIHAEPGRNVVWAFPAKQVGAGYSASIVDIVRSSVGRNYRPSDVSVAPDGSLFIADWFDPVDCCHRTINDAGRIFRVAPPRHAYAVPAYDFKTSAGAAKALRSPNLSARYKAWTALIGMQESARPALETMASDDNPRFRARALWALAAIKNGTSKAIELALGDESENIRALGLRIARRHQLPVEPVVRQLVRDKSALVRRECAVSLHRLTSAESVQLWTELAAQYDGKDRWYLEALGIGEKGKETVCLNAWLKKTGEDWNSRAGRDIIWRLRAPETAALLAKLLLNPSVPAAEHPRLLRALDFHDAQPKEAALTALLEGDAKHNPATYLEAFQRATPKFLEKHPEVLKRVESAMLASKGTVTFVDMVARFNRKDMVKHLMDMVQAAPEKEPGIRAAQQIFAFKEGHRIASALNKPNQAPALLKTLGFVGNDQAVAILRAVITDEARLEASRLLAITALGQSSSGAGVLMQLVQQKKLPAKFMPPAIQSLAASPGPNTRSFAAQHLNLLAATGKRWPIELLLEAKPDASRGKAVFQKAGCIACHIVQGEGLDFGPELSDIGNKLSSEQLFEAILKPNQNISLGYEGVNVALKDGTQLIGFVTSESKTVLSLRIPGGLRKDVPKADIKTRTAMKDSLMPIGLDAVISPQELVDLVGWLSPQLPELLAASIHGSPDVDIAVPNGTYTLQLLLYEGWRSRAADIVIEGKTVRAAYDMFKEQGGNFNQGSVLRHSFTLADGNIDIQIKGPLHLGGLILSKGKGGGTVSTAIVKSKSDLDFKDVLKAINFGDTRNLSIGNVNFIAAAVNNTVDGVTNKAAGDVYAGEHNQKLPLKLHK
jgi:putative membrane-bound dehydrogenase-like protein